MSDSAAIVFKGKDGQHRASYVHYGWLSHLLPELLRNWTSPSEAKRLASQGDMSSVDEGQIKMCPSPRACLIGSRKQVADYYDSNTLVYTFNEFTGNWGVSQGFLLPPVDGLKALKFHRENR